MSANDRGVCARATVANVGASHKSRALAVAFESKRKYVTLLLVYQCYQCYQLNRRVSCMTRAAVPEFRRDWMPSPPIVVVLFG